MMQLLGGGGMVVRLVLTFSRTGGDDYVASEHSRREKAIAFTVSRTNKVV